MNKTLDQVKWAYVEYCGHKALMGELVEDPWAWLEEEYLATGWSVTIEVAAAFIGIWILGMQQEELLRRAFAPEVVDEFYRRKEEEEA